VAVALLEHRLDPVPRHRAKVRHLRRITGGVKTLVAVVAALRGARGERSEVGWSSLGPGHSRGPSMGLHNMNRTWPNNVLNGLCLERFLTDGLGLALCFLDFFPF
jgi:hypothetical protein